jgi:hypothetical protein
MQQPKIFLSLQLDCLYSSIESSQSYGFLLLPIPNYSYFLRNRKGLIIPIKRTLGVYGFHHEGAWDAKSSYGGDGGRHAASYVHFSLTSNRILKTFANLYQIGGI